MRELHDDDLRKLFRTAGHAAPEQDLTGRIMARVAVTPMHEATTVQPVIGKRGWALLAAALVLAIVLVCTIDGEATSGSIPLWLEPWMDRLGSIRLPSLGGAPWLAMAAACTLFFLWVDRWLSASKSAD
ncbi:MAG TPA: hypothetical protein VGE21_08405 [Flavobacteriales bacterium]